MSDSHIVLAGVGGQGILSIATVIDNAALAEGYTFKQSEVHGMSQRGGAVQSHLRLSKGTLHSDLIPLGGADLVLSVEPLEALRYVQFLKPQGLVVTSMSPFVNIPDYPDTEGVYARIAALPGHVLVDAEGLARRAGSARSENMVMLGAASPWLPFGPEVLLRFVADAFAAKGEKVVKVNQDAFRFGRAMASWYRQQVAEGEPVDQLRLRMKDPAVVEQALGG